MNASVGGSVEKGSRTRLVFIRTSLIASGERSVAWAYLRRQSREGDTVAASQFLELLPTAYATWGLAGYVTVPGAWVAIAGKIVRATRSLS